jgi:hypothetical protein
MLVTLGGEKRASVVDLIVADRSTEMALQPGAHLVPTLAPFLIRQKPLYLSHRRAPDLDSSSGLQKKFFVTTIEILPIYDGSGLGRPFWR